MCLTTARPSGSRLSRISRSARRSPACPKVGDDLAVRSVAERLVVTPAQVGLAWLLARADNILLIPGTSSLAHLEENLGVVDVHLSDADLAELNDRPAILHKHTGDRGVAT